MITLRPYQLDAIARVRTAMRGTRRVLLVAPTGFGKTAVASELIRSAVERGRKVLFLVHRREIVHDTARRLRAAEVHCAICMAGVASHGEVPVTVASVQTIIAREARPPADLVIWDEAHHTVADSYREIASAYPDAYHLGLTATPERTDRQGLRDAFDAIVIGATMAELQALGFLAALDVIMPGRTMRGGLAQDPVEAWHKFAFERPAVIFAKTVDQSQEIATALGPRAAHVDGETPKADRDRMLERFARGEIDVLTNVFVLTEGWDCPRAKVCILARGQGSIGPYIQMVGRVMRPHNGERALLIDLPGAMQKHGKPDEIRDFTLDGIKPPAKSGREWLSQCEVCGTTVPGRSRGEVCPECGVPWPEIKPIAIAGVELVRYQEAPMSEKRSEFARLSRIAAERGYRDGWVAHRYRAKFGVWPRGVRA